MSIKRVLLAIILLFLIFAVFSIYNNREVQSSYEVAVLCYHHIVDREPENDCEIRIENFKEHMEYLYDNDYHPLSLEEFLDSYKNDSFPDRAILLTFDDGYASFYHKAYPVLKRYQFPATIFPIVSHIPGLQREILFSDKLSFHQIRLMDSNSGLISVGSHSYNLHHYADTNRPAVMPANNESSEEYRCRIQEDLRLSKNLLSQQTDMEIKALAWPFGVSTNKAKEIAIDANFKLIFTLESKLFTPEDNISSIPRVPADALSIEEFKETLFSI